MTARAVDWLWSEWRMGNPEQRRALIRKISADHGRRFAARVEEAFEARRNEEAFIVVGENGRNIHG